MLIEMVFQNGRCYWMKVLNWNPLLKGYIKIRTLRVRSHVAKFLGKIHTVQCGFTPACIQFCGLATYEHTLNQATILKSTCVLCIVLLLHCYSWK